jgi:hypothetical protein
LDAGLVSKWEAGFARLRAPQVQIIQHYLAQRLLAAKERFAAMELPELDAAIEEATR